MAYTTIDDPSAYFHTQLYTGNDSARTITNDANAGDFKPDWLWVKHRNHSTGHSNNLVDSTRGGTKTMYTNTNDGEETITNGVTGFATDGFTLGTNPAVNDNSINYVAWQWKANGGTTSSNTDGSITSTVQANTTAGFSIVTYTGTGSAATIGHGLGKVPAMMLVKKRSASGANWAMYHNGVLTSADARFHYIKVNSTDQYAGDGNYWNDTAPTTSVFTVGSSGDTNASSATYVAYCFAEIQGYSKFDSYEGNGSSDGTFIYTGFRPSFIWMKNIDAAENWLIYDNKRDPHNVTDEALLPNSGSASGGSSNAMDLLSNGFKLRQSAGSLNGSNKTFMYIAFAEHPFVSSEGVPVTAR